MKATALVDLRRRSFILKLFIMINSPELYHMHQHTINSQNFVKYMQCSVIISSAFESNHIADMSLQSF